MLVEIRNVERIHFLEEFNVVLVMELSNVLTRGHRGPVHRHLGVEVIIENQGVSHWQPVRLHGVAGAIVIIPHLRVVEVGDPLPCHNFTFLQAKMSIFWKHSLLGLLSSVKPFFYHSNDLWQCGIHEVPPILVLRLLLDNAIRTDVFLFPV